MKLFKYIFFLLVISLLFVFIYNYYSSQKTSFNPISSQNNFFQDLQTAINTSQIQTSSLKIRDFNNEVEFYVFENDQQIKIILSSNKNPFWQISVLHNLLKTVKINQGKLKLVDLSSNHPYATFKNN